jgi:hypothetical protein
MSALDPKAAAERLRAMLDGTFHYTAYRGKAPDGAPTMRADLDAVLSAPSKQAPLEGVKSLADRANAYDKPDHGEGPHDDREWVQVTLGELRALRSALLPASAEPVASLDERMKAAGMIPLSDLLAGNTALKPWMAHTGVKDLESFEEWLAMRHREFMTMRVQYELGDKDKTDELYEWVYAHAAALDEVMANLRAAKERSAPPASGAVEAESRLVGFNDGRRVGLEEAATYILTWFADPNRRSMANGIRALALPTAPTEGR